MKKLIFLLMLTINMQLKAQNIRTQYDTCQYLTQYEGEWLYSNNSDTIRIYLRSKRQFSINFNHFYDNLYGWHEYKQGNTIIESNYANRFMYLSYYSDSMIGNRPSISLLNYNCTIANSNKLQGYITDISQANEYHAVKTHMWSGNGNTFMLWKQSFVEFHGAWTGAYGMTLPREFILVKQ